MTDRRAQYIAEARRAFNALVAGQGNPLNLVPMIHDALANAGEEADVLDPARHATANEILSYLHEREATAPTPIETARSKRAAGLFYTLE